MGLFHCNDERVSQRERERVIGSVYFNKTLLRNLQLWKRVTGIERGKPGANAKSSQCLRRPFAFVPVSFSFTFLKVKPLYVPASWFLICPLPSHEIPNHEGFLLKRLANNSKRVRLFVSRQSNLVKLVYTSWSMGESIFHFQVFHVSIFLLIRCQLSLV